MNITLNLEKPVVGAPPFEFPSHSFRAYWADDGMIGVVAVVKRQDGGFHIMRDIIALPQKEEKS